MQESVAGTVLVADDGCFHLDTEAGRRFVVWPVGTQQDGALVRLPDGRELGQGDPVSGRGWQLEAAEAIAAADGPDGYLATVIGFCADDGEPLAVLAEAAPV
ncbi:hypothetical protein [Naasia sp. SYSU D00057]|uniref:hypothetical protein n=1 Tax=Naasia sp. SYSU D00057 TaxID=2817380 RepID=UPI001B314510|nr:hypothetical protein [Naasia sp. SYSU D00057]